MSPVILLVIVGVIFLYAIMIYNRLVQLKNQFKNAFAQIDVQLKRRYDLIPNLVESSKAYLKHEKETLTAVITARNAALSANQSAAQNPANGQAMKTLINAESALGGAMSKLLAVFEQYPDLKANQTIQQLMEELSSTENKVAFSRQAYNDSVMSYNTACETFPNLLIARPMGFQPAELFQVESAEERKAVKVSF